eukprot:TRINITY_DN67480_c2_g1_i2.p1 TRINITY_DN67480_c2_g1~~TRINITY_DN67480_c2_g1_i2.p1  ORF type:complete len:544 (+),score=59.80 TRINITY_DN67480_c2_g1_i2:48-1679(+)
MEEEFAELNLFEQYFTDQSIQRNIDVSSYIKQKGECILGRTTQDNPGIDVAISSQKFMTMVSRRHASIKRTNGRWFIVDHKSTNGVLLNDKKLEPRVEAELHDGDKLTFGTTDSDLVYTFEVNRRRAEHNAQKQQQQQQVNQNLDNLQNLANEGIYDQQKLQEYKKKVIADASPWLLNVENTPYSADLIQGYTEDEFRRAKTEFVFRYEFDFPTKTWERTVSIVEIEATPFDKGNLRMCFRMWDWTKAKGKNLYVAKLSLERNEPQYTYFADAEMQSLCKYFSHEFNKQQPPKPIDFVEAWILQRIDHPNKPIMACEMYLPGKYVKHSNNYGWCSPEDRNTPHAFSHFTYEHSNGTYLVVDIQGVDDLYTDPQIHSKDQRGFGKGNVGSKGIQEFFRTHLCNTVCEHLGIALPTRRKKVDIGTKPPQLMSGSSRPVGLPSRSNSMSGNANPNQNLPEVFHVSPEALMAAGMSREQYNELVAKWRKFDVAAKGEIQRGDLIPLCQELGVKPQPNHLTALLSQMGPQGGNLKFQVFVTWWWQIYL